MAYDRAPIKCFLVTVDGRGGLVRLPDGRAVPFEEMPVGAMYLAHWRKDGRQLYVKTPGGLWFVDGRASNCSRKDDDKHRCWVRHGEPPNITVDKNGDTCACGCSIGQGENYQGYHGFLRNGILEAC